MSERTNERASKRATERTNDETHAQRELQIALDWELPCCWLRHQMLRMQGRPNCLRTAILFEASSSSFRSLLYPERSDILQTFGSKPSLGGSSILCRVQNRRGFLGVECSCLSEGSVQFVSLKIFILFPFSFSRNHSSAFVPGRSFPWKQLR